MPCIGCGRWGVELHHTMLRFPEKRHRRDHRFQIPICPDCHRGRDGIHGIGNEVKWWATVGKSEAEAIAYVQDLWLESIGL